MPHLIQMNFQTDSNTMLCLCTCASVHYACLDLRSQAATSDDQVIIDQNNFSDELFRSFRSNIKPCETYYLSDKLFSFDNVNTSLIIHINISSLQLHFEELKDFLDCLQ